MFSLIFKQARHFVIMKVGGRWRVAGATVNVIFDMCFVENISALPLFKNLIEDNRDDNQP